MTIPPPFSPLDLIPVLWLDGTLSGKSIDNTPYACTGTVTQVATALIGLGTAFLNEVAVGDVLTGVGISGTVTAIADATNLTLSASAAGVGVAFTVNPTAGVTDRLSQINDLSGAGNHATQATPVNRLLLTPAGSGINGLASFRSLGKQFVESALSAAVLPFAGFAVVNAASLAAARSIFSRQVALNTGVCLTAAITTGKLALTVDAESATSSTGALAAATTAVIAARIDAAGNYAYWFNGIKDAITGTFTDITPAASNVRIGANHTPASFMFGQLPAVLRYHRDLSDADMVNVSTYLKARYGVT